MHLSSISSQWATLLADAGLLLLWFLVRIKLPSVRFRQWLHLSTILLVFWGVIFWALLPLNHAQNFTIYGSFGTYVELGAFLGLGGAVVATLAKRWLEPAIPQAISVVWWRYGLSIIGLLLAGWLSVTVIGTTVAFSAIFVLATFLLSYTRPKRLYSGLVCAISAMVMMLIASTVLSSWGALPHFWAVWGPVYFGGTWQDLLLSAAVAFSLPAQLAWWLGQPIPKD